jgi:predicted metallopeptidase
MKQVRRCFDFTTAMRALCADIVSRLEAFSHIDVERVAFNICQTRRDVSHGMYASLTPLRFAGGNAFKTVRGVDWGIQEIRDDSGRDYLYLLSFYLPRFQNSPLEEKLITVFHELWHIGPDFDGDLRRHEGRCYAHGHSQREYDLQMKKHAQQWLSLSPPCHLYEFLSLSFDELVCEHGPVTGSRWSPPKLVRR